MRSPDFSQTEYQIRVWQIMFVWNTGARADYRAPGTEPPVPVWPCFPPVEQADEEVDYKPFWATIESIGILVAGLFRR